MTDLMIDLEYLGQHDNAVITQIACVPFDICTGDVSTNILNHFLPIQDQLNKGRVVDESTMIWWMSQCVIGGQEPSWVRPLEGKRLVDVRSMLINLRRWFENNFDRETVRMWYHCRCDGSKLYHILEQYQVGVPWRFGSKSEWHIQTVRQITKMQAVICGENDLLFKIQEAREEINHDAVDDCIAQIKYAHLCWRYLGL